MLRRALADHHVFWREFRRNFHTTGAVLPSSRALGRALSRFVRDGSTGRQILEAGPGTGAVTRQIVRALRPDDRLDLVELNPEFVRCLNEQFNTIPPLEQARGQIRLLEQAVQTLPGTGVYDLIISGLPLNNFQPELVREILDAFERLLKPGGTLSFFQYIGVRGIKRLTASKTERARLEAVGRMLAELLAGGEIQRDWVWMNVPPAWAHHVRLDRAAQTDADCFSPMLLQ